MSPLGYINSHNAARQVIYHISSIVTKAFYLRQAFIGERPLFLPPYFLFSFHLHCYFLHIIDHMQQQACRSVAHLHLPVLLWELGHPTLSIVSTIQINQSSISGTETVEMCHPMLQAEEEDEVIFTVSFHRQSTNFKRLPDHILVQFVPGGRFLFSLARSYGQLNLFVSTTL